VVVPPGQRDVQVTRPDHPGIQRDAADRLVDPGSRRLRAEQLA